MKLMQTHRNEVREIAAFLLGYAAADEERFAKTTERGTPIDFGYFGKRVRNLLDAVLESGEYAHRADSWTKDGRRSGAATYLCSILANTTDKIIEEEGYIGRGLPAGDWLHGAILEAVFVFDGPIDDDDFKAFWRK